MVARSCFALLAAGLLFAATGTARAQMPQIPTLQTCTKDAAVSSKEATVRIDSRAGGGFSGEFTLYLRLSCDAKTGYPTGTVKFDIDMTDSVIKGDVASTAVHQLAATGELTPTAYASGWCEAEKILGCRFWLMVADNNASGKTKDQDIASFLILDADGKRMAYGTGPVVSGDIKVKPAP